MQEKGVGSAESTEVAPSVTSQELDLDAFFLSMSQEIASERAFNVAEVTAEVREAFDGRMFSYESASGKTYVGTAAQVMDDCPHAQSVAGREGFSGVSEMLLAHEVSAVEPEEELAKTEESEDETEKLEEPALAQAPEMQAELKVESKPSGGQPERSVEVQEAVLLEVSKSEISEEKGNLLTSANEEVVVSTTLEMDAEFVESNEKEPDTEPMAAEKVTSESVAADSVPETILDDVAESSSPERMAEATPVDITEEKAVPLPESSEVLQESAEVVDGNSESILNNKEIDASVEESDAEVDLVRQAYEAAFEIAKSSEEINEEAGEDMFVMIQNTQASTLGAREEELLTTPLYYEAVEEPWIQDIVERAEFIEFQDDKLFPESFVLANVPVEIIESIDIKNEEIESFSDVLREFDEVFASFDVSEDIVLPEGYEQSNQEIEALLLSSIVESVQIDQLDQTAIYSAKKEIELNIEVTRAIQLSLKKTTRELLSAQKALDRGERIPESLYMQLSSLLALLGYEYAERLAVYLLTQYDLSYILRLMVSLAKRIELFDSQVTMRLQTHFRPSGLTQLLLARQRLGSYVVRLSAVAKTARPCPYPVTLS